MIAKVLSHALTFSREINIGVYQKTMCKGGVTTIGLEANLKSLLSSLVYRRLNFIWSYDTLQP